MVFSDLFSGRDARAGRQRFGLVSAPDPRRQVCARHRVAASAAESRATAVWSSTPSAR